MMMILRRLILVFVLAGFAHAAAPAYAEDDPGLHLSKADIAYGEYLSGECVTCHHQGAAEEGIPNINGLNAEAFIIVMRAFKNREIDHELMQTVAGRLDDEQIASLAVYFASLPPPE